ncbi:DNA ligase D [Frigidibacter sp. MR17.24]|uniref:DNA ligase D n=1 Tax=Frigidibacter sp. MR17.24 TaxID=3127345 RepID=UPI003013031C
MDRLARYNERRDFTSTAEPEGVAARSGPALRYGIQMHAASRLHWDLRLEWQGVLLSWAVTRGPSNDPADKRLSVRTEDHPVDYLGFEGTIPQKDYGGGTAMLWDIGWWQPFHDVEDGLRKGHLHFALHGRRATGSWSLVRLKGKGEAAENWLLVKDRDAAAVTGGTPLAERFDRSILSNRSLSEIARRAEPRAFGPVRRRAIPRFRAVQLAELQDAPPAGEGWQHEIKLDGYRAQIALGKGGVRIRTRNGHDWTDRFAELVPPLAELRCDGALIDGEIVAGAGLEGFGALQDAIKTGGPFRFVAFDLLALDGRDLADEPLSTRRTALEALFAGQPARGLLRLSPAIDDDAAGALATVCGAGGEGLVSKRLDAPYLSGRGPTWVKAKCVRRAEFLICGWQPSDRRGRPFASLLLATCEAGHLTYRGKVGTGFDEASMAELVAAMRPLGRKTSPLDAPPPETRGTRWIRPALVAEIAHAEVTRDGQLRHARFVALREDKRPAEVVMDVQVEVEMARGDRVTVAGIGISHPDRVIFPKPKRTKLDLARYCDEMADRLLPGLADRPLSLLRLPEGLEGERFFQKHAGKGFPKAIRSVAITESDGKTADYMAVTDAAGLVAAVQMGTVEFHPWGARRDRLDRPERLVFDLDPDEGLGFAAVRRGAFELRDRLDAMGLAAYPMVSGGKGIHVIVPLTRTIGWDSAKIFAQLLATVMSEAAPDRYTATMSKAAREGRIFIDWLRNERGATAIAPFSVRARPGAPVAVPLAWDELSRLRRADGFDMERARERTWSDLEVPPPQVLNRRVLDALQDQKGEA